MNSNNTVGPHGPSNTGNNSRDSNEPNAQTRTHESVQGVHPNSHHEIIRTNVVLGRITVDDETSFDDIRQAIEHVLRAFGLSSSVASTAAAVATAATLATNARRISSETSTPLYRNAWASVVAARQPSVSILPSRRGLFHNSSSSHSGSHSNRLSNRNLNRGTRGPLSQEDIVHLLDALIPALAPALRHTSSVVESLQPSRYLVPRQLNADPTSIDIDNPLTLLIHELSAIAIAIADVVALHSSIASSGQQNASENQTVNGTSHNFSQPSSDHSPQSHYAAGTQSSQDVLSRQMIVDEPDETETSCGNTSRQRNHVSTSGAGGSNDSLTEEQVKNTDFVLRVLTFYRRSIIGVGDGLATEENNEEEDGVKVLDKVDVDRVCQIPTNSFLRAAHKIMQAMTSAQVRSSLRGDLSSVAEKRHVIWNIICASVSSVKHETNAGLEANSQMGSLLATTVWKHVHEVFHSITERVLKEKVDCELAFPQNICHAVKVDVKEFASSLFQLFCNENCNDSAFADKLLALISKFAVRIFTESARVLKLNWEEFMVVWRDELANRSRQLFGSNFAILLPLISNIVTFRIKHLFEEAHSHSDWTVIQNANSHQVCGPSIPLLEDDEISAQVLAPIQPNCPCGPGQSQGHSNRQCDRLIRRSTAFDLEQPNDYVCSNSSDMNRAVQQKDDAEGVDVYLDDCELDDLVAELGAELGGHSAKGSHTHTQPDQLACELESDFTTQSQQNRHPQPQTKPNGSSSNIPPAGFSVTANSMGFGAPVDMLHASRPVNRGQNSATNTLSFASSISAQRSTRSTSPDEFDEGLSSGDARVWRRVVSDDVAAMRSTNTCGALSRAYRFDGSPVPSLDEHHAVTLAVESARNAARAACLSEDATQQLLRVAAESGGDYLRELEIAISSRLGTDNEFARERFPEAYRRFMLS